MIAVSAIALQPEARFLGCKPPPRPGFSPVGFGHRYLGELLRLEGDEGARSVIGRHPRDVDIVECGDRGILRDIDTTADLDRPAG